MSACQGTTDQRKSAAAEKNPGVSTYSESSRLPAPKPATKPSSSPITADDMKREKKGRFGTRDVFGVEKDGTWVVVFTPALPRNDRTVLNGAEYVLRQFMNINTNNAKWRPVDMFLRCITAAGPSTFFW